jgi:hypothetical protein
VNAKVILPIVVILLVIVGSVSFIEYERINTLNPQIQSHDESQSTQSVTTTQTIASTTSSSYAVSQSTNSTGGTLGCPSEWTCINGTFAYSTATPGPVRVLSVQAGIEEGQNGSQNVTFFLTFENSGSSPLYFIGGWANTLSSTIQANSSVLTKVSGPVCPGAYYVEPLGNNQDFTAYVPDCEFAYQLTQAGTVNADLTLNWTTNAAANIDDTAFTNSTTIWTQFTFP